MDKDVAVKFLWEDYKTRLTHYWSSFNRFALAVLTVLVIPYIRPEAVEPLGRSILFLPLTGLLLSLASTWLLGAEYQRLRAVKDKYDELIPSDYKPDPPNKTFLNRLFGRSIGKATTIMFGVGLVGLSAFDFYLLLSR